MVGKAAGAISFSKYSLVFGLFLMAICVSAACRPRPEANSAPGKYRLVTLRNITRDKVEYTLDLNPSEPGLEKENRLILPGELQKISTDRMIQIFFRRGPKIMRQQLKPGTPYSFRYDEFNDIALYEGAHGREDAPDLAPYVPTPPKVVDKMLEVAEVNRNDRLYDLGCGDGRILIAAAKKYGTRGFGIDIVPARIEEARIKARQAGVEKLVEFRLEDALKADFSPATKLALYLLSESNELLRPALEAQLKPGTLIIAHDYPIPGWEKKRIRMVRVNDEKGIRHTLYLYRR